MNTEFDDYFSAIGEFYSAIGEAITRWTHVEERIYVIFSQAICDVAPIGNNGLDFGNISIPSAAFFSIESFRGRLELTNSAISAKFRNKLDEDSELPLMWQKLYGNCRKLSAKRNKIAHHTVLPGSSIAGDGPRLVPSIGSPGYYAATGLNKENLGLNKKEINDLIIRFIDIRRELTIFSNKIGRDEVLFENRIKTIFERLRSYSRHNQKWEHLIESKMVEFQNLEDK